MFRRIYEAIIKSRQEAADREVAKILMLHEYRGETIENVMDRLYK